MESKESKSTFFSIFKIILIIAIIIAAITFIGLFIGFTCEVQAYIEANNRNIGIVTDKSYETAQSHQSEKYTVTIERKTTNSAGETKTKTETYTITYEEWLQIEEGYVATYNKDGSIDILPPSGENQGADNVGIVTAKSPKSNTEQLANKYTVTVERQAFTFFGEVETKTETYTIPYEDWTQVEVGHIATYNDDGSIDINPPAEGESLLARQPLEPFGQTFWQYGQEKMTHFFTATIPDFFSSETNVTIVVVAVIILAIVLTVVFRHREETNAGFENKVDEIPRAMNQMLHPYADEEKQKEEAAPQALRNDNPLSRYLHPYADDEEEGGEELSWEKVRWQHVSDMTQRYTARNADFTAPYAPDNANSTPCQVSNASQTGHTNSNQSTSLTVRQIRALVDNLSQIEITESYITLAGDYNNSLTTDFDDREVAKLSISSGFSPKIVLDITPKRF